VEGKEAACVFSRRIEKKLILGGVENIVSKSRVKKAETGPTQSGRHTLNRNWDNMNFICFRKI